MKRDRIKLSNNNIGNGKGMITICGKQIYGFQDKQDNST